MARFIPTRRNNPCPICQDTSGDCRLNGDLILCHSFPDGGITPPDYRFTKPTKDGIWGIYTPSQDDWTTEQQDYYRQSLQAKREQELYKIAQQHRHGLSVVERDRHIRTLATAIGLNSRHRQQLLNRGLSTEAIEGGLYFSVCPDQPVPPTISDKLPGIGYRDGKKILLTRRTGYACVAFDPQGQALGWQIRDEDPNADNKYTWAKSAFSSHLQNGELPLTLHGNGATSFPIWLVEGILKPHIASHRHRIHCLGASGGNFLSSPQQFQQYLGTAQSVILAPDAGDVLNSHVYRRWCKVLKWLRQAGIKAQIAWWGQITKRSPDIDELHDLTEVQYLTPKEWHRQVTRQRRYWRWRQYTPDILLKQPFLTGEVLQQAITPYLTTVTTTGLIVGIKAPLGNNKTGSTGQLLNLLPPTLHRMGVIQLSDLNRLLFQSVERYNTIKDGRTFYHLHEDAAYELVAGEENLAACFQSLRRWFDEHFDDKIIVIDESLSVIKSFLDGDTLKHEGMQRQIAHKLRQLLQRSALILILDGNLTDENCRLIQGLSNNKILVKLENIPPQPRRYHFTTWPNKELMLHQAIDHIKAGYRVHLTGDNATELRKLYQQLLDMGMPPEQMLIADKNSSLDECPEAFLKQPTAYLEQNLQIRVLINSPAMNRGFDVDGDAIRAGHHIFDRQYGLFENIIGLDQIDQQLFRIRSEQTERHLWIAETAKVQPRSHSYTKKTLHQLTEAAGIIGVTPETKQMVQQAIANMVQAFEQDAFFQYEQQMRAAECYEQEAPRQRFQEFMQAKGCTFSPAIQPTFEQIQASQSEAAHRQAIKQQWQAEKLAALQQRAKAIVRAPMTVLELKELQARQPEQYRDITPADISRRDKLEKLLPSFTTSDVFTPNHVLFIEQNPQLIQAIHLFSMLSREDIALCQLEQDIYNRIKEYRQTGFAWLGDFKTDALRIKAYNEIGMPTFIQAFSGQVFTKDTPELQALLKHATHKRLHRWLGVKPLQDNIKYLKRLLKPLGLTTSSKPDSKGYPQYQIIPLAPHPLHEQILSSITIKIKGDFIRKPNWEHLFSQTEDHPDIYDLNQLNLQSSQTESLQAFEPIEDQPEPGVTNQAHYQCASAKIPVQTDHITSDILTQVQTAVMELAKGSKILMYQIMPQFTPALVEQAVRRLDALGGQSFFHRIYLQRWVTG